MAILSAVFSLILRQITTIVQAIFGWSITALFGKLPSRNQTALSVALVLSIVWPLLVVGCFFPNAAAWALAFLPLHKWVSSGVLRAVWIVLAVIVPLGVGTITRVITSKDKLRGGVLRTVLGGYLMAVGYFLAFVITAVTVPIVKVLSTVHRWSDCHVYIQAREGRYDAVLDALVDACARADARVERENVPARMALANTILQKLAGPFVKAAVASNPQRLRGKDLQLYLYASDLLLRGEAQTVAHVRAAMTRTDLEQEAYTVDGTEAQKIQDEIAALWCKRRDLGARRAESADTLRALSRRLDRAAISFDDWTTLEVSLRRLERAVTGAPDLIEVGSDRAA